MEASSPSPRPPVEHARTRAPSLGYMPGLDGIRALAVLAIIAYHSGFSWLPGGYYSVDAFFALSGFLITSLLIAEHRRDSHISLGGFWVRRARRLLPGLFLMLTALGILSALWPGALDSPHLRSDALFTIFYTANWHFIAAHSNYFFVTAQPSPLLHTWTLAIEEQFYFVWPLVVVGVLRYSGRRRAVRLSADDPGTRPVVTNEAVVRKRLHFLLGITLAGAAASAIEMGLLYHQGGDATRVYYGTDTRAQSLLVGASCAIAFTLWKPAASRLGRTGLHIAGVVGTIGCGVVWSQVNEGSSLAFHGGFLIAGVCATGVIACVSQLRTSPVARVLSVPPLRYLGKISYGVYLWYWPTLLLVDHARTHLSGYPLAGLRIAAVVAIATVSYFLVEKPIRQGTLRPRLVLVAAPAGAGAAVISIFAATAIVAPPAAATSYLGPVPGKANGVDLPLSDSNGSTTQPGTPPRRPVKILLVGDSMAGSLGVGLEQVQASYGAQVVNEGSPGCSSGMDGDFKVLWYTTAPGTPCVVNQPSRLLSTWQGWVNTFNPDVAVYMARGDLLDQSVGGHWENVGQPAYDAFLTSRLRATVQVLSAKGGRVVFLTVPVNNSGEKPDGSTWPEDDPARVGALNAIITKVAGEFTGVASVIDLAGMIAPGDVYSATAGGVTVRCSDGVHLTAAAGRLVASRILSVAVALSSEHALASPSGSWPGYVPGPPDWYAKLNCPS